MNSSGRPQRIRVAALLAVATVCAACSSPGQRSGTGDPATTAPPSPSGTILTNAPPPAHKHPVTIAPASRCPTSVATISGVRNTFPGQQDSLLPAGQPTAGLVCEYGPDPKGLRHTTRLDGAKARSLALAVRATSLHTPTGETSCPPGFAGADTLIALSYSGLGAVDLWYETSGCRTLDNGSVTANEIANPSFYNGFMNAFAAVAPAV